jgi:hypothetical protein
MVWVTRKWVGLGTTPALSRDETMPLFRKQLEPTLAERIGRVDALLGGFCLGFLHNFAMLL